MMAAAPLPDQQQFHLHHSSPLDTLVRKTSQRSAPRQAARDERRWPQANLPQITTQRQPYQMHHPAAPSSPLLHSRFDRQSSATWASNDNASSYLDLSKDSDTIHESEGYGVYDAQTPQMHRAVSPALRDSWQSNSDQGTIHPGIDVDAVDGEWPVVPTVMISEPVSEQMGYATSHAGKTPIIRPTTANFSRPARSAVEVPDAWEDEQKQRVLERNGRRTAPNTPDAQSASYSSYPVGSPLRAQYSVRPESSSSIYSTASASRQPSQYSPTSRGRGPEPPRQPPTPAAPTSPEAVALFRRPPSPRSGSPVSLYSTYSFYQLDSATPSPTEKQFSPPAAPAPKRVAFATASPAPPRLASPSPSGTPATRTANEFLQLGIQHHEADRLPESAACFERAATLDGGCGVGMLMWGLALRHGWGCAKNEKHGFKWLRRAAEHAVGDLEAARTGGTIDEGAVQTELVLAIYEVGQCFFHGWGIPKDQKMGVSYYAVAARMGDADAQMDLAFCLANGKGAKKDRKEAAKWYRAAVAQGQSDIGLAWIYKEKFQ
ncbi:hypothetical protein B0H17DRAFT_1084674 [Mycena rosella]|uniref:HCP-like protein n=1 Tax=Mycena rosella TaxID=1033263 RepID=A0AAD7D0B9_MYCRO|nr:hypothetical protein B0H17DRAFT_1084674 [Mycena rosella]